MSLFERIYQLVIGQPGCDGFQITDLDISFVVKKSRDSIRSQNKLSLKIYNLSKEHIDALNSKENLVVILKAGFENDIKTIFQGQITKSTSKKTETDYETDLEASDGYIALRESKSSQSFPPNTSALTILKTLCNDLLANDEGLSLGEIYGESTLENKKYRSGYSALGFTKAEIQKILRPLQMTLCIQNQIIFVSHVAEKTQKTEVFILTKDSGLIHSPQKLKNDPAALKNENISKNGITFQCLLNGSLNPLDMVKVQSADVSGVYKIIEATHSGEFLGDKWDTSITAMEVL